MKDIIINALLLVGIIGLLIGYPELAYLSGMVKLGVFILKFAKGLKASKLAFGVAIFIGLGFSSISPFSWWQGILIGFTFVGVIMMISSLFPKKLFD